jgi:hypothetical protein
VLQYFLYVGAGLLALLFLADANLPRPELRAETPHHATIRIAATDAGPAAVTFSGPTIDHGAPPALQVVDLSALAAEPRRQAFAQAASEASPQAAAPVAAKPPRQRPRKRYVKRPVEPGHPRVAEVWSWPGLQPAPNAWSFR